MHHSILRPPTSSTMILGAFGGPGEYNQSFYFILPSDTTILSQLMSTPSRYQSELCLALGSVCGSVNPTTNTTSALSVNEDLIQSFVIMEDDGPTTGLDEANEFHGPSDAELDVSEIFSQYITVPTEHVRQVMRTADEQFASARMPPTATQSGAQASCWGTLCRWPDESAPGICGAMILCNYVSAHFKYHSIKDINESESVQCRWEQCFAVVGRKNFVRHVRECHLGHSRGWGHSPRHSTGSN
ncbi:hypothetical protein J3R82DRAFT_5364 [Butyriboletus roseoflavus]|nr:hypothetical protein J3R82DRAFT_5364 [Butyriboletus roseoflavus]